MFFGEVLGSFCFAKLFEEPHFKDTHIFYESDLGPRDSSCSSMLPLLGRTDHEKNYYGCLLISFLFRRIIRPAVTATTKRLDGLQADSILFDDWE